MRILPVLDLQDGFVVRGVAGRRKEYRPIASLLCDDPSAASVARGLRNAFGFDSCYLADLDAIAGHAPNIRLYDEAAAAGLELWIDSGAGSVESCLLPTRYFAERQAAGRVIVGLELLPSVETLTEAFQAGLNPLEAVFSLDLLEGRPLSKVDAWADLGPLEIAEQVIGLGVPSLIVLDMAGVGVGQGVPTLELCRELRGRYPYLEIISGGGVRDVDDLFALEDAGCDAALVASALHDGRITREHLGSFSHQ